MSELEAQLEKAIVLFDLTDAAVLGGAERRFLRLFFEIVKDGDWCLIMNSAMTVNAMQHFPQLRYYKDKIICIPDPTFLHKRTAICKVIYSIYFIRLLIANRVKYIHFPVNIGFLTVLTAALARALDVRFSVSIVASSYATKKHFGRLALLAWQYVFKKSDWIDCLSPSILTNCLRILNPSDKIRRNITVSPCSFLGGAEETSVCYRSGEDIYCHKNIDLIFVSRLVEDKGVDLLIELLLKLEARAIPVRVVVCGSGPLMPMLAASISKLHCVDVSLLGYIPDSISWLRNSKVLLSLQRFENYPSQVILEAAYALCSVVATDVGDTRLIVNDKTGLPVDTNVHALFEAVQLLLDSPDVAKDKACALRDFVSREHTLTRFKSYFERYTLLV